jgi:hypothetical protein
VLSRKADWGKQLPRTQCRRDNTEQRLALGVLADAGRDGAAEAIMAARFGVEVLAGLVRKGWASVDDETVHAGGSAFAVVRMKITEAGRHALAARSQH